MGSVGFSSSNVDMIKSYILILSTAILSKILHEKATMLAICIRYKEYTDTSLTGSFNAFCSFVLRILDQFTIVNVNVKNENLKILLY